MQNVLKKKSFRTLILVFLFYLPSISAQEALTVTNIGNQTLVTSKVPFQADLTINATGNINTNNKITESGNILLPRYVVLMWAGNTEEIPAGWALCNGQTATAPDGTIVKTPDLKGRFIVGFDPADNDYKTTNPIDSPKIGGEKQHTLTVAEMPSHNHGGITGEDSPDHTHEQFVGPVDDKTFTSFTGQYPPGDAGNPGDRR